MFEVSICDEELFSKTPVGSTAAAITFCISYISLLVIAEGWLVTGYLTLVIAVEMGKM